MFLELPLKRFIHIFWTAVIIFHGMMTAVHFFFIPLPAKTKNERYEMAYFGSVVAHRRNGISTIPVGSVVPRSW